MKRNIFVIEGALMAAAAIALSFTVPFTNDTPGKTTDRVSYTAASLDDSVTAGVAGTLQNLELETYEKTVQVSIENGELALVTAALADAQEEQQADSFTGLLEEADISEIETEAVETVDTAAVTVDAAVDEESAESAETAESEIPEEVVLTEEEQEWLNYLMPDVQNALNVRADASEDAELVGKLYKGDRAVIVEQGEEWTRITSGNVEGYVKNSYCVFGTDALAYAKENCALIAKSTIDGLRVRKEPSLEGAVTGRLDQDEKLTVDKEADTAAGWIAVRYKNDTCYVSADYVTISMKLGTGVTMEEEAKAQQEAAKSAAASAKSSSGSSGKSSGSKICDLAYEVDEVTLLAGIIECEAGGQDYEALLAVGAVVMNRVNSSSYPDTIFDVIFQKGQFPPATSGKLEKWLNKGPSKNAIKAAKAAIAGDDNTGGKMDFNSVSSGHSGTVIGDNVFY